MHNFLKIFGSNFIEVSRLSKFEIFVKNLLGIFRNPGKTHLLAHAADISSAPLIKKIYEDMKNDEEGRKVLKEKPLLIRQEINFKELKKLPKNTLGYHYISFLESYKIHAHDREVTHFFEDPDHSYILTRYRQMHDIGHVAYNLNISLEGEAALKLIEAIQTKIPVTVLAVLVSPFMLPVHRFQYIFKNKSSKDFFKRDFDFTYNELFNYTDEMSIKQYDYNLTDYFHVEKIENANLYTKLFQFYLNNINNSNYIRGSVIYGFKNKKKNDIVYDTLNNEYVYLKETKKDFLQFQHKPRNLLLTKLFPWALNAGMVTTKPIHSIYVESWLDKDINEFRKHYNIIPLPSNDISYISAAIH